MKSCLSTLSLSLLFLLINAIPFFFHSSNKKSRKRRFFKKMRGNKKSPNLKTTASKRLPLSRQNLAPRQQLFFAVKPVLKIFDFIFPCPWKLHRKRKGSRTRSYHGAFPPSSGLWSTVYSISLSHLSLSPLSSLSRIQRNNHSFLCNLNFGRES
jgi:hypothetical protein